MEKILFATSNPHKVLELKEILQSFGLNDLDIVCPKDFNDNSEPVEDGKTFAENSLIKAKYYFDKYHLPTLADDSGISIDFFDGKPGIYSARFLPELNYEEKCNYIVNKMVNCNDNRGAQFTCVVTYIDSNGIIKQYEGILEGNIALKVEGTEGFGYDPIFVPKGEEICVARLGQSYKNDHSHRYLALRKFADEYKK